METNFPTNEDMFGAAKVILKRFSKPDVRYLCPKAERHLQDPECLSVEATVFRNGGEVDGVEAVPFVRLTPALRELLKAIFAEETSDKNEENP